MTVEFKIGDRVKVTKSSIEAMVGEVGTIRMKLPENMWWVQLDNRNYFQQYFYGEEINLLEDWEPTRPASD
jgi:hypothetical protein